MKAVVLCPGPSLPSTWPDADSGADVVIAVNRAASFGCDWLVAYDGSALRANYQHAKVGCLSLGTGAKWLRHLKRHPEVLADGEIEMPDVAHTFSINGALALAAHLGATEIEVHGDDKVGRAYFDGALGNSTSGGRWTRERVAQDVVESWLAARGVTVATVRSPVYVSFATPEYREELQGLSDSAEALKLPQCVSRIGSLGSWVRNAAEKARVIAAARANHPGRAVVYLDADARVMSRPSWFNRLDCDFACRRLRGVEVLSGTLYFGPTDAATRLIDQWIREIERTPEEWDQRCLSRAMSLTDGVRSLDLPWTYCHIFDHRHDDERAPVIVHRQASRRLKNVVNNTVPAKYRATA